MLKDVDFGFPGIVQNYSPEDRAHYESIRLLDRATNQLLGHVVCLPYGEIVIRKFNHREGVSSDYITRLDGFDLLMIRSILLEWLPQEVTA